MQYNATRNSQYIFGLTALTILVHAWLLRLYYFPLPKKTWGDETFYFDAAVSLLAGNPHWQLEPLWPLLYPRFLAGIISVSGPLALPAIQAVQFLLLVISALVLADFTKRISGSDSAGRFAALLMLCFPPLAAFTHYLWPEILHLFLLVALVWILKVHADSLPWAGAAGLCLGLTVLTKSLLMPLIPILLALIALRRPKSQSLARVLVVAVVCAMTLAPTLISNMQRLGTATIANSGPFNFWVGLNDRALRSFEDPFVAEAYERFIASGESLDERNLWVGARIREHISVNGFAEVLKTQFGRQYFRFFDKDSFLTSQLPDGPITAFGRGYLGRTAPMVRIVKLASYTSYALILLLAPLGFTAWFFSDRRWFFVLLGFLFYVLTLALMLHVKSRYRIQVLPVFFIGAGCAWSWIEKRIPDGLVPGDRRILLTALPISTILLFFAFSGPLFD